MTNSRGMWELFDYEDGTGFLQRDCPGCDHGIVSTYTGTGTTVGSCGRCLGSGYDTIAINLPESPRGSSPTNQEPHADE